MVQGKWHTASHNLRPGDVVIVADKNTLRGDYCLALVKDVSCLNLRKLIQTEVLFIRVKLKVQILN